jgi:potassium-transporting ATPase KdpC subunit
VNLTALRPALRLLVLLSVITGLLYPLVVTAVAGTLFTGQSHGSLIELHGEPMASRLIGQQFTRPEHFWSRPSATAAYPYQGTASGASNLGPLNPALVQALRERIAQLRAADPGNAAAVPVDLVTASASGLDPDISVAAALYQVPRVARARRMSADELRRLVQSQTQGRVYGFMGEPRVNVVELNIALDAIPARSP